MEHYQVVIAGAGPTGLLTALRLGQAGVKTLILEKYHELANTTRAVVYQPVVLEALRGLGIFETVTEHAYLNREGIFWRNLKGEELAHLSLPEHEYVLLIGQKRMAELILREVEKCPSVEIRFNRPVAGCKQDDNSRVMVMMQNTDTSNDEFVTADWLIGADGANSVVRRCLCIPFEGFSFTDFRMIGADVYHDFKDEEYGTVLNFIVDPEDWAVIVYTGQDKNGEPYGTAPKLWRVAYTEPIHLSSKKEDILERAQQRVRRYTKTPKGLPGVKQFDIPRAEPYRLHQRCAARAVEGKVVLIGDALHANNPIGGLGLTTGILDAYAVGNALSQVCKGDAPDSLLIAAANYRRQKWQEATGKYSLVNLQRLRGTAIDEVKEREEYFRSLGNDPDAFKMARETMEKMAGLDFSQDTTV